MPALEFKKCGVIHDLFVVLHDLNDFLCVIAITGVSVGIKNIVIIIMCVGCIRVTRNCPFNRCNALDCRKNTTRLAFQNID